MNPVTEARIERRTQRAAQQAEERGGSLSPMAAAGLHLANGMDTATSGLEDGKATFASGLLMGLARGAVLGSVAGLAAIAFFGGGHVVFLLCVAASSIGCGVHDAQNMLDNHQLNANGRLSDAIAEKSGAVREKKPLLRTSSPEETIALATGTHPATTEAEASLILQAADLEAPPAASYQHREAQHREAQRQAVTDTQSVAQR